MEAAVVILILLDLFIIWVYHKQSSTLEHMMDRVESLEEQKDEMKRVQLDTAVDVAKIKRATGV